MTQKNKVAVLMGGMSAEHDVSINSGRGVAKALEGDRYHPMPVVISREGQWTFPGEDAVSIDGAVGKLCGLGLGCVFIALHGTFGEDGRIQGLLDLLGLPYTGSGSAASALAMDKIRSKAVVEAQGIRVAAHAAFDRRSWDGGPERIAALVKREIGFPCVTKAARQGSSVGIDMPRDETGFRAGVPAVFEFDDHILVEEYIEGTEVTCSVLEAEAGRGMRALPLTEICPKTAEFFDYEAKYTPGATDEITPARIDAETTQLVQEIALSVHRIVGCKGWSRSDFIIDESGPVWIEVNTVPGLTETSLFPQACAADGISYAEMAGLFVEAAMREARDKDSV